MAGRRKMPAACAALLAAVGLLTVLTVGCGAAGSKTAASKAAGGTAVESAAPPSVSGTSASAAAETAPEEAGSGPADGYIESGEPSDFVDIRMDSGAHIVIELLPDTAPATVANFQKLVGAGFYDGLVFHRVIDGFMIQGGDPEGTGLGGAPDRISGEFASNGFDNTLSHRRGVVSMARSQDPNSASSQFFICQADSTFLDGDYAAFGRVLSGMDEVDRIARLKTDAADRPQAVPVMKSVRMVLPAEPSGAAEPVSDGRNQ